MDDATRPVPDAVELSRRLRETEAELARVTLRLRRLENSTSVQLARLLAAAVRNPREGLVDLRLAVALILRRARRRRGRPDASSSDGGRQGDPATPVPPAEGAGLPQRLLAASAVLVTTRDRPVLAVVADQESARRWSEDAHVQRLRPDDALVVFAAGTPDLLVIDAAAGRNGPWSGLGTYVVPERDRTVLDLLRAARVRGIPAVLRTAVPAEEVPLLADARQLFSARVSPGAGVADLVAAARESA